MDTIAVVFEGPERLALRSLDLASVADDDVVVDVEFSGISTGTERLFWTGRMPPFPGMGYPLVPGYESVGRVVATGSGATDRLGEYVFVPGATCFTNARGLFGGAAHRLIAPSARVMRIQERLGARGVLLALAATAHHAIAGGALPDLIIGHGALGRLLARIALALDAPPPTVWERDPGRRAEGLGYKVIDPADDERKDYRAIYDASGDSDILDTLVGRLERGGEITLAGFYQERLSFAFPPSFMREARFRVAAEWRPDDLRMTQALMRVGRLTLDSLITHECSAEEAADAYATAFTDSACLKMVLDWRHHA
ncbi:MAG: chlorophyll synthesis pathway protein BchC [Alphaproteobacteria bacterium]|nr:chlorophyll synthesis pathway protein BchC [Alphaproteobacteria bacterium]